MTKEELEKKAEEYVRNKADKGNFDLEQFGKAYFSESSLKQAYIAGYEARNEEVKSLKEKIHWWKKEVNVAHRAREDEFEKLVIENKALKRILNEAKEIISEFIKWANWQGNSKCPSFKNIQDKAEAFLKEE